MMTNVHATDEDLYTGFGREDVAPALETNDLEYDRGFQAAVKSSYGRRPPTSGALKVPGTAAGPGGILASRAGRIQTAGQELFLSSIPSYHETISLGCSMFHRIIFFHETQKHILETSPHHFNGFTW